jgi:hypothetical protein
MIDNNLLALCKAHGRIKVKSEWWVFDYAMNKPRPLSEITKEEMAASEKAKWEQISKIKKQ